MYTIVMAEGGFNPEAPQEVHFEQEFAKKEVIQTTGGRTEIVDIKPVFQKDTVPIILAPGWGETLQTHKKTLQIIHDGSRRVLSLKHPRIAKNVTGEEPSYPMAEIRKMQALIGVISQKKLEKVDVIAHSEGAIYAIIAATLHPDKFRNIVLVSPGGLIGEDKFHKLVGRMLVSAFHDITQAMENSHEKGLLTNAAIEMARYFAKNPTRAVEELYAIAQSDILEMVKNLHESGIGISVFAEVDDPIFPISRITEILRDSKGAIDGFYSVKEGHNKLITDARYTTAALNALDDLRLKPQRMAERIEAENNVKTSPS